SFDPGPPVTSHGERRPPVRLASENGPRPEPARDDETRCPAHHALGEAYTWEPYRPPDTPTRRWPSTAPESRRCTPTPRPSTWPRCTRLHRSTQPTHALADPMDGPPARRRHAAGAGGPRRYVVPLAHEARRSRAEAAAGTRTLDGTVCDPSPR